MSHSPPLCPAARQSLSRDENHHAQQSKRDHNSANDGDSVQIDVHCLSPHSRKRTNRLDDAVPPDLSHAALADEGAHFVGAEALTDGQGHELGWIALRRSEAF